jgi:hypothetical protein
MQKIITAAQSLKLKKYVIRVNSGAPEGKAVPAPLVPSFVLI